jgi:transcriptional regulator with XRE-family HTH domain
MSRPDLDYEAIAAELLRALRGNRSQRAFAQRLGYQSNTVYSWESKRASPTAARALWAAERAGVDVSSALLTLYRKPPGWMGQTDATTPQGIAQFLRDLQGSASYKELAERSGKNRFQIARWLKGQAEPRLPVFLHLVECMSLRLLDFVAALVDPAQLPSIAEQWRELDGARQATYREPWSQAVLRVLETQAYAELTTHDDQQLAAWLGIDEQRVRESLEVLLRSGQAVEQAGKFVPATDSPTIDTRRDPEAAQALREFWSEVALGRLRDGQGQLFSYNLFGVSEADLQKIRELQKAHYQQIRAIVAASEPVERVALLTMQLSPLL